MTHAVALSVTRCLCLATDGSRSSRSGSRSGSSGSGHKGGDGSGHDVADDDGSMDGGGDDLEGVSEEENFKRGQRYKKLSRLLSSVMVGAAGP